MNSASLGNLKWVKELMCIPTLHQLRVVKIRKKIFMLIRHLLVMLPDSFVLELISEYLRIFLS